MTYQAPLPNTGAILPVLGSGQAWEGSVYNGNFSGVDSAIGADRARLTTIEGKIGNNAVIPAGTTAARDGFYGTPSTAAGRVALANTAPRWFNTDKGYEERYFAPTSDSGQAGYNTLFARSVGGWGPQGAGLVPVNWVAPVVSGGGSATVAGNTLNLVGANTTVLDAQFTADFDAYFLVFDLQHSTAAFTQMIMRTAGVDYTSYNRQTFTAISATAVASVSADTKFLANYASVNSFLGTAFLFNPAQGGRPTFMDASSGRTDGQGRITQGAAANAVHDGVKFSPSAGTGITGSIKLFGLAGGHI